MKVLPRFYVCCLLLVIVGTGWRNTLRSASKHNTTVLAMTQVINQIEPFCRVFVPDYDTLHFLANPSPSFDKNGTPRHLWNVDCLDAHGNRLVYALWDADQQSLIQIGRCNYRESRFVESSRLPALHISAPQGVCTAHDWVIRLQLATEEEIGSSRRLLRCFPDILNVNFYLPSRSLRVAMTKSGEIRGVFVSNISESSLSAAAGNKPDYSPCKS